MATIIPAPTDNAAPNLQPGQSIYQVSPDAANLLGSNATAVANELYASPNVTPQNANTAVTALFGGQELAAQDTAQAQAQDAVVAGDTSEVNSYLSAAQVADQDARLARISAGLTQAQEDRTIYKTVSGQTADIAGAGFGNSGSAMYLMADSVHQGAIAKQLMGVQGEINAEGYEQQSLAATAEANAAQGAANQAAILGNQASTSAGDATTAALNSAMSLLATGSGNGTGTGGTGNTNGTFSGVSADEAAQDAAYLGYKNVGGQMVYQGNGGTGGYGVTIDQQGQTAAQQYVAAVNAGTEAPANLKTGNLKTTQDSGAARLTSSGLG